MRKLLKFEGFKFEGNSLELTGNIPQKDKFDITEKEILNHPIKREIYERLKNENIDKANKYVEFFIKIPDGIPRWNSNKKEWSNTTQQSNNLLSDYSAPSTNN
jgi:hypothetical protein